MKLLEYIEKGKTYIIAEMSANHAGSIENAKKNNIRCKKSWSGLY